MNYFQDKTDVVRFVKKTIQHLDVGSQLTIIIDRDAFADFFVHTVTAALSDDTLIQNSSKGLDVT